MLKQFMRMGAVVIFFLSTSPGYGQKSTEIFIPVGKSPGLSGKYTVIGKIEAVNAQKQTIALTDSSAQNTVKISKQPQIWLDKSKMRMTNQVGTFNDLRKGAVVEIKFEKNQRKNLGTAEWVKVEIAEPDKK